MVYHTQTALKPRLSETVNTASHSHILLVYELQPPILGQAHIRHPQGVGWHMPPSITDHITDQYAPYCSELGYAVSSEYRELADYWWM